YPGSGWSPIRSDVVTLDVDALGTGEKQRIKINEYLLQKGESRQMVYYWYQSRGRVIANEYVDRFYMILDSILRRRSDGALVRISGAVDPEGRQKVVLLEFIRELYPHLQEFLPE
ncbi:MAG TPA: EpsI family protein, partial [Dissulfuribacter thermophilus]|nr:EpsI family protein [Dissulfuribacter thermophilus]